MNFRHDFLWEVCEGLALSYIFECNSKPRIKQKLGHKCYCCVISQTTLTHYMFNKGLKKKAEQMTGGSEKLTGITAFKINRTVGLPADNELI